MGNRSTNKLTLASIRHYESQQRLAIPDFQRGLVWTQYQKQLLIDSLLRDIDIPKIYFVAIAATPDSQEKYEVVDGQQRVSAILNYFENKFALDSDCEPIRNNIIQGLKFSELPGGLDEELLNANLDVVYLRDYTDEEIKEMFVRLQEGVPLNAPEKRRALPGNVPGIVAALAGHKIFTEPNFLNFMDKRFAFQDRCAKILHQFIEKRITPLSPKELRDGYDRSSDLAGDAQVVKSVKASMNFLHKALKKKAPKLGKYAVLRLVYLVNELRAEFNLADFSEEFGDAWISFELARKEDSRVEIEDQNSDLVEFRNCARGDSLAGQKFIHEHLKKVFLRAIPALELKDPTRNFSADQRWEIFHRSDGCCEADREADWFDSNACETVICFESFHADHHVPHTSGGKTTIKNGRALCAPCNLKKKGRMP